MCLLPFCQKCGAQLDEGAAFCSKCGAKVTNAPASVSIARDQPEKETAYYDGDGELIIKRTKHKGLGTKAASWLALGPVGYIAFGRDKKSKSKAKGRLVVTNKALYCAGNEYPFDKILSITKQGRVRKSISLQFDTEMTAGGTAGGYTVEVELKTDNIDALFDALERAKLSKVSF